LTVSRYNRIQISNRFNEGREMEFVDFDCSYVDDSDQQWMKSLMKNEKLTEISKMRRTNKQ
jgi:hypothetical protein